MKNKHYILPYIVKETLGEEAYNMMQNLCRESDINNTYTIYLGAKAYAQFNKILNKAFNNMEQEKYYTPDISELYVGYECEWLDTRNDWTNLEFKLPNDISLDDTYRTKYLDSDDIISLGFQEKRKIINSSVYFKEEVGFPYGLFLVHHPNSTTITIDNDGDFDNYECYFKGDCKSINELKKILSWIK